MRHGVEEVHPHVVGAEVVEEVGVLVQLRPEGELRAVAVPHIVYRDDRADLVQLVRRAQAVKQCARPRRAPRAVVVAAVFDVVEPRRDGENRVMRRVGRKEQRPQRQREPRHALAVVIFVALFLPVVAAAPAHLIEGEPLDFSQVHRDPPGQKIEIIQYYNIEPPWAQAPERGKFRYNDFNS